MSVDNSKKILESMGKILNSAIELLFRQQWDKAFKSLTVFTEDLLNLEKEIMAYNPGFWTQDNKKYIKDILNTIQCAINLYSKGEQHNMLDLVALELWPIYEQLKNYLGQNDPYCTESSQELGAKARVLLRINQKIQMLAITDNELLIFTKIETDYGNNRPELLFWKLLSKSQQLFESFPISDISFELIKSLNNNSDTTNMENVYAFFCKIVMETNQCMKQYQYIKGMADSHENVLFYCFENDTRFSSIYESCLAQYPGRALFKEIPSGWDYLKRKWEASPNFGTIEKLVEVIKAQKIKKIVFVNNFIYESFINKQNIFLPPILNMLGIELLGVDYDTIEMVAAGPLERAAVNSWEKQRFSFAPSLFEPWDQAYNSQNVFYTPVIQHYSNKVPEIELDKDYDVIILTHSRLEHFDRNNITLILFLLQEMKESIPFTEHELWYYAMCRLVRKNISDNEVLSIKILSLLFNLMYKVAHFLKYEVIYGLETDRQIKIFGDKGWGVIYPDYYQNSYISQQEIKTMHNQRKHLYLLMNNCFSYIEAGGPVYDAIKNNLPFINYRALLKTQYFQGFRYIEYTSHQDLNHLVNNAAVLYKEPELIEAMVRYNNLMHKGEEDFINIVFNPGHKPESRGAIQNQWLEHKALLEPLISEYMIQRKDFLQHCFDIIVFNKGFELRRDHCPYLDRPYTNAIYNNAQA